MISYGLIIIWLGLFFYKAYKWMFHRPDNFPPGPPRMPILGAYGFFLLMNYKHLHKAIGWLCKYYNTDVLGFYTGPYLTIVAHSADAAREALNNPAFDGKPALPLALLREPDFQPYGIFFSDGELWHDQRRYMLRQLRDFGFGRRFDELELEVNEEILQFIDYLKNGPKFDFEKKYHDGSKVLVPNVFSALIGNCMAKVVFNERLPREKLNVLHDAADHSFLFAKKASLWGRMFSILPWVSTYFPYSSDYVPLREHAMNYHACIKAIIDEQYATFDRNHERHFLDKYFLEMENAKDDPKSFFFYSQLVQITLDFFLPPLIGVPVQLQTLIQQLLLHPEVVSRCQQEIDEVVGPSRLATLNDRINLPYVEATVRESMRHRSLAPDGLPHISTEDAELCGYKIPKGTIVFSSIDGGNYDKRIWNQPELFQPERFLDKNGKFSPKLDKSLPFGAGKRLCAGETFARNMMFVVVAALLQNFNIAMPKGEKIPTKTITGFLHRFHDFQVEFLSR